jgi:LPXTG-motif cell wall-anchored protein
LLVLLARTSWAQQTTASTTEMRSFEVVSVEGNKVVIKDANGAREITVPPDFKVMVDGKEMGVDQLKPGMKGTATITTTTTSTPVYVTEVRDAEVIQATGNSVTVRTANGYRMFGPGDVTKRNAKIMRDGKPIDFADIRNGDHLTAVIITEGPPVVLTERDVKATLTTPAPPPPAPKPAAAPPPPPPPPTPMPEPTAEPTKKLPKTATDRPLIGAIGGVSLVLAMALALRRRRSALR